MSKDAKVQLRMSKDAEVWERLLELIMLKDVRAHWYYAFFWRMSRTRHASQTTKVNTMIKAQTFSTRIGM